MRMKNWWMIIPIILCAVACKQNQKESNYVIFSGHIKNASMDSIYVMLNEREKGFALDFDGNFSDTIQLNDEGYKTLAIDREEFPIYLIPGDSLHLRVDINKFDDTFIFHGKGADRNNYLFYKENLVNSWMSNEKLFQLEPEEYRVNLADFTAELKNQLKLNNIDASFQKIEKKNLYFDEFNLLYAYRDSYAFYNPTKPQLPVDFINFSVLNLDQEEDFNQFTSYRSILNYYFDELLNRGSSPTDILSGIKSEKIKYAFIRSLIDDLDEEDETTSASYFAAIEKFCKYQPWLEEAKAKLAKNKLK